MSKKRKLRNTEHLELKEREDSGQFGHSCGCLMHVEWSEKHLYVVHNIKRSKKFGATLISEMRKNGFLLKQGNFLCTACYNEYKNKSTRYFVIYIDVKCV